MHGSNISEITDGRRKRKRKRVDQGVDIQSN